ncbi:hypothetical protein ACF0H5_008375 [Mactra antiquata]
MRDEGRPIYYCDKTFVHSGHQVNKCWLSAESSLNVPISKGYVARRNVTIKMSDVKRLIHEGFKSITEDIWTKCCRHVMDIETQFQQEDITPSQKVQKPVIIPITGTDSEETDSVDESTDSATDTITDTAPGTDTDTVSDTETDTAEEC